MCTIKCAQCNNYQSKFSWLQLRLHTPGKYQITNYTNYTVVSWNISHVNNIYTGWSLPYYAFCLCLLGLFYVVTYFVFIPKTFATITTAILELQDQT